MMIYIIVQYDTLKKIFQIKFIYQNMNIIYESPTEKFFFGKVTLKKRGLVTYTTLICDLRVFYDFSL